MRPRSPQAPPAMSRPVEIMVKLPHSQRSKPGVKSVSCGTLLTCSPAVRWKENDEAPSDESRLMIFTDASVVPGVPTQFYAHDVARSTTVRSTTSTSAAMRSKSTTTSNDMVQPNHRSQIEREQEGGKWRWYGGALTAEALRMLIDATSASRTRSTRAREVP